MFERYLRDHIFRKIYLYTYCYIIVTENHKIYLLRFLADRRRMNVALTRAKYACYVVGHMSSFRVSYLFAHVVLKRLWETVHVVYFSIIVFFP